MGGEKNDGMKLDFDPRIRLEFVGSKIIFGYRTTDLKKDNEKTGQKS